MLYVIRSSLHLFATRSNSAPNLLSFSRMMNWCPSPNGVMLRSCWAVHSAVGARATPTCTTRFELILMTKNAKSAETRHHKFAGNRKPKPYGSSGMSPSLPTREFRRSGLGHVSLNCAFRRLESQVSVVRLEFVPRPRGHFQSHAVNKCDDLRVHSGNTAFGILRFPTPKEPKSFAVPTEHCVRFHEQQGVPPMGQKARKQNHETALMILKDRSFDFPRCDNELLTKQGVLHQQLGPRASNIGNETSEHGEGSGRFSNCRSNSIEYSTSH